MNFTSINSPLMSSYSTYLLSDIFSSNQTYPLFQLQQTWTFLLFLCSLFGIIFTLIILFFLLYYSFRHLNDHHLLLYFILCLSICFIYLIVIFFLLRGNEVFCGLREFLSQFAYVLLFSTFLTRYIMQWLSARILSQRTKQSTTLLIYFLLVFTQIPIGILWWYFTIPRYCPHQQINHEYPKLKIHFHRHFSSKISCSNQCIVDYRFYATYTYIIFQLFLCTILAISLVVYRYYHRNEQEKHFNSNHRLLTSILNLFGLILIDCAWFIWTCVYYFTQTFFVFPSLIFGMFTIATISLVFILLPQMYSYSKNTTMKKTKKIKTTLFKNKLASTEDIHDQDLLLQDKSIERINQNQTNESEMSYEIGTSGTFLPITRTPKGLYKSIDAEKLKSIEKFDRLMTEGNASKTELLKQPLQRQLTSSSLASDFVSPTYRTDQYYRSNSNLHPSNTSLCYSSYIPPYRDETLIPILCSSQKHPTSTPVKMRVLVKSSSSSVPTTRRFHSGADHRYIQQHPYQYIPPPPATPLYRSPSMQQPYVFVDSYRTMPSYSSNNLWSPNFASSHRYPYAYRRFQMDNRSLSQRLWDIDSVDDQDEIEENLPIQEHFHTHRFDQTLIQTDKNEDESPNSKLVFV